MRRSLTTQCASAQYQSFTKAKIPIKGKGQWQWRKAMQSKYKLMLTAIGAFALGAAAMQGLHAQIKPPAFAIAEIAVKDEAGYKNDFLPKIQPIIKEHGGKYLAGGFNKTWTQIGEEPPNRVVLIQYDSMDAFKKYAEATTTMIKESKYIDKVRIYAVEGVEQK
jgi:uncharacterized protein (DUF1330 family)